MNQVWLSRANRPDLNRKNPQGHFRGKDEGWLARGGLVLAAKARECGWGRAAARGSVCFRVGHVKHLRVGHLVPNLHFLHKEKATAGILSDSPAAGQPRASRKPICLLQTLAEHTVSIA